MCGRGEIGRRCRLKIGFHRSAGSSPAVRTILSSLLLLTAACDRRPDTGAVVVSAIGPAPTNLSRDPLPPAARLLVDSTAQGLVRFDAGGQIEPGLAERWIVIDQGTSYIFRLREAQWADGSPVTADQVSAILRRRMSQRGGGPLAPFLTAIGEIVVMTPQVIEVRLRYPRPDLLKLFAQPELAIARPRPAIGSGPFRITGIRQGSVALRPAFDPNMADPEDQRDVVPEEDVRLIGERAARAIVRFVQRRADLVTGGTFADWPLLATVRIAPADLRIDPAAGLFGLAIVSRDGFLGDALNRGALAQAIDRGAVTTTIAPAWEGTDRILPDTLDSARPPAVPGWTLLNQAQRQAGAAARVASWTGGPVRLRIAMPAGPGGTLLYAQIAASLRRIGVAADRVAIDADADLRLVDAVAPYDSARWYLATACQPCSVAATAKLEEARQAPTMADRAARIAEADVLIVDDVPFIPIARPLRWSLVAPRLSQWQANARAWHPLNRLRTDPNSTP